MTPEELAVLHPRLYHLTERDAVPKIREHGLWSTAALVRGCRLDAVNEDALLRRRRRMAVPLDHPTFGRIIISDNKPLSEGRLSRCLDDGLAAEEWLSILNSYVFFWAQAAYAQNLREAQNNRTRAKALLVFDTLPLIRAHFPSVALSPINSGATRTESRRGIATFAAAETTDWKIWRRSPTVLDSIKEIVVRDGVPDASRYLLEVVDLDA